MALKAILVAVAVALFVVVAAPQAMTEKEVLLEEKIGWKMVNHLRLLDYVRDSSSSLDQEKINGGGYGTNLVIMKQTIAIPRKLLEDSCTNYKCHPKVTECPDDCAKCPEDEEDPRANGVDCEDL